MRIAIASDIFLPQLSGIADSIGALSVALKASGHAVRIYAPRVPGAKSEPDVCRLLSLPIPGSAGELVAVLPIGGLRDMRRFKPDVIHTHTFSSAGLLALYASRRLGVPLVGTDHTFPADYLHYLRLDFRSLHRFSKRAVAQYYDRCNVVTAPSQALIDELRAHGLHCCTAVISNPIATDLFRPLEDRNMLKRELGIGPEAILVFGRIAIEKNLDMAMDLFAAVAERRRADLVVVGDGPDRAAFERGLAERRLTGRCRLLGELHGEPLVRAINACDVYLITSTSETQSMTTLQAAASGLPVVAIRAGGLPEYVVDGQTGYVVDPGDRDRFVDRLITLIDDRGLARQMGRKGRELASRFAPGVIAGKFVSVYEAAMAQHQSEPAESAA